MEIIRRYSRLVSMCILLSLCFQMFLTTYSNAQKEDLNIVTNGEEIIIEENGYMHTIKTKKEFNKMTTYILDENNNIENYFVYNHENKKLYSSITNRNDYII